MIENDTEQGKAPSVIIPESLQSKDHVTPPAAREEPKSSRKKLMGFIVAALLASVGYVGYQQYDASSKASASDDDDDASIVASNAKPEVTKMAELDPEKVTHNEGIEQLLIGNITEIKNLIQEKQYTLAQTKIDELGRHEAEIDTSRLKMEVAQLIEDEDAFQKKLQEEKTLLAEKEAALKEKQRQANAITENEVKEAKKIWEEEASAEREVLRLANEKREETLNYIASNQPRIEIKKHSSVSDLWEAKVVLKRPDNQPKEITLKFSKNKLLNKTSDAMVKVIGPHIEKVDGKKQLNWELIVTDAVLAKTQLKQNILVNEQKKKLLLKEQSIRKKHPQYAKYFPN